MLDGLTELVLVGLRDPHALLLGLTNPGRDDGRRDEDETPECRRHS